jgi:diguanylate cyclase (GGDEF)-like protein/PAS domain S-box-containing protein
VRYNYPDLLDKMPDAVYFVDSAKKITYWNKAAEKVTGYRESEVMGKSCADNILVHVDDRGESLCLGKCPLAATMADGISREAEVYLHHKNGHRVPVLVRVSPLRDVHGNIIGGAELFTDNSSKEAMILRIKELEELAMIDTLTRLANRRYIESELEVRIQEKSRYNLPFGLLFMDIDHFKRFNDNYGHDVGDRALITVANTLRSLARPYDLIGRWGGEEFIAIIRNVDMALLTVIGERLRSLVEMTYIDVDGKNIGITLSVGAAIARDDDTPVSILKRSDMLMYLSKENGRNCLTAEI